MEFPPPAEGPVTVIVTLKVKPEHIARAEQLWHEGIADIEATEPAGNIKYAVYRNNAESNEYTVIQTFASAAIREAYMKDSKHQEMSRKVFGERLFEEGSVVARYCSVVAKTQS